MKLYILVGGMGTRLRSLVSNVPKPLAPIGNSNFIELLIKKICNENNDLEITLLAGYKGEFILSLINTNPNWKNINVLIEPEPLGTGGAILNAIKQQKVNEDFIVLNGDTWIDSSLDAIMSTELTTILAIRASSNSSSRYGFLTADDKHLVKTLNKKSTVADSGNDFYINTGAIKFNINDFLSLSIPDKCSLENDILNQLVTMHKVNCAIVPGSFIDIGVPEDYLYFKNKFENEK